MLYASVNYEVWCWKKIWKSKNWKIKISEYSFTLKTFDRGVFFPIIRTIKSGIFGLLTVNYEEGSMPIKYNALFMNKQHPNPEVLLKTQPEFYKVILSSFCLFCKPCCLHFIVRNGISWCFLSQIIEPVEVRHVTSKLKYTLCTALIVQFFSVWVPMALHQSRNRILCQSGRGLTPFACPVTIRLLLVIVVQFSRTGVQINKLYWNTG